MTSEFKDLSPRLVKSTWHPSFGLSKPNICIEYEFKRNIHVIEFYGRHLICTLFLTDNFPPEGNAPATRTYEHAREWIKKGA